VNKRLTFLNAVLSGSWYITLSSCVLSAISGCGNSPQVIKDRAIVSGKVTFGGQPLPAGTLGFESTTGPTTTAVPIGQGGAYSTDRAPVGKVLVTVDTSSIHFGNPAAYVPIPEKYNNSRTSGLTAEIKPGENENVNFDLQK
jgi:hypothetical protein